MNEDTYAILDAAKEVIRRANIVATECVGANEREELLIATLADALNALRIAPEPQSLKA